MTKKTLHVHACSCRHMCPSSCPTAPIAIRPALSATTDEPRSIAAQPQAPRPAGSGKHSDNCGHLQPGTGAGVRVGPRSWNRHSLSAVLTYVSISYCIQCNCLHSYIASDASSSTASSGTTLIKDNRRFHAAQPPLLAWPALLSLSKNPDSARQSVPALWLAGSRSLTLALGNVHRASSGPWPT